MKYKWIRQMDGMPHVSAQVVGTELARLEKRHKGKLQPHVIVTAATPPESKLHPCFEWNNTKAANKYRERQASEMLRKIVIKYEDAKDEVQHIRAFVNITSEDGEGYYCHTGRMVADPILQNNVLEQILAALIAIKNKYAHYKNPKLQKIWGAIDDAMSD